MNHRSLLLHSCWSRIFDWLNSNLCLNSFVWFPFKNLQKGFLFLPKLFLFASFQSSYCSPASHLAQPANPPAAQLAFFFSRVAHLRPSQPVLPPSFSLPRVRLPCGSRSSSLSSDPPWIEPSPSSSLTEPRPVPCHPVPGLHIEDV
jgi:hypothetical protein